MINLDCKPPRVGKPNSSKSPHVDPTSKFSRADHGQPNTLPHTSAKVSNLSNNITVSRLPYQRRGKLNELISDVNSDVYKAPPGLEPATKYLKNEALSSTNQTSVSGLKFIEGAISNQVSRQNSTNAAQSLVGQNVAKSLKVDRASLPEISDQHKSKEMAYTTASRAASNHSQLQGAAQISTEIVAGQYQFDKTGSRKASLAT